MGIKVGFIAGLIVFSVVCGLLGLAYVFSHVTQNWPDWAAALLIIIIGATIFGVIIGATTDD